MHHHALMSIDDRQLERLDREWRERHGITTMRRYVRCGGAANYCSKYITKDHAGFGEWNFYDSIWETKTPGEDRLYRQPIIGAGYKAYIANLKEEITGEEKTRKLFGTQA